MDRRKQIYPNTEVGLKLAATERKLTLDLMCLNDEFEEVV
jgi:hypothetical protein